MNQELEQLTDLALADGNLTDKKREILNKKAKELNVDPDEFEMYLDGKLYLKQKEMQAQPPPVQAQAAQTPTAQAPATPAAKTLSSDPMGKISEIITHVEENSKKDPSIMGGLKSILGDLMD